MAAGWVEPLRSEGLGLVCRLGAIPWNPTLSQVRYSCIKNARNQSGGKAPQSKVKPKPNDSFCFVASSDSSWRFKIQETKAAEKRRSPDGASVLLWTAALFRRFCFVGAGCLKYLVEFLGLITQAGFLI